VCVCLLFVCLFGVVCCVFVVRCARLCVVCICLVLFVCVFVVVCCLFVVCVFVSQLTLVRRYDFPDTYLRLRF
jgi:hypothetical protein